MITLITTYFEDPYRLENYLENDFYGPYLLFEIEGFVKFAQERFGEHRQEKLTKLCLATKVFPGCFQRGSGERRLTNNKPSIPSHMVVKEI